MSVELVVFLGNPGEKYRNTRHNAGWLLAAKMPPADWQKKFKGLYAAANIPDAPAGNNAAAEGGNGTAAGGGRHIRHFLMPETFMNDSGEAAREAAAFFKIPPESVLVVHDELELKLGELSLKRGGGLGGHNGLRSAAACLGTPDFWRLRIGIGRPGGVKERGQDILGWVLSAFTAEEKARLDAVLAAAAGLLLRALASGPETLLPEWRKKTV